MSTVAFVALARPTFDLESARANFESAKALLADLGATLVGPDDLVMTVEDLAAVKIPAADLHILFMASFSSSIISSPVTGSYIIASFSSSIISGRFLRLRLGF